MPRIWAVLCTSLLLANAATAQTSKKPDDAVQQALRRISLTMEDGEKCSHLVKFFVSRGMISSTTCAHGCFGRRLVAKLADLDFQGARIEANTSVKEFAHVLVPCRNKASCVSAEFGTYLGWRRQENDMSCGDENKNNTRTEFHLGVLDADAEMVVEQLKQLARTTK